MSSAPLAMRSSDWTLWVPKMPSKDLTLLVRIRGRDHRAWRFFVVGRGQDHRLTPDSSPPSVEPAAQERDTVGGGCSTHVLWMTVTKAQHPVETLTTDGADEALGEGVGPWCPDWGADIRMPSDRNTSSELEVNLVSRSLMRNLTV